MKKERIVILLGLLVALVFFYFGLNEWLKTREEQSKPPPPIVRTAPVPSPQPQTEQPAVPPTEETKPSSPVKEPDMVASKVREERSLQGSVEGKPSGKVEDGVEKPQTRVNTQGETVKSQRKDSVAKTSRSREAVKRVKPVSRTYTVQVGAFKNREGAEKVVMKARSMGYAVKVVEEDNFYKVRLVISTDNIQGEMTRLKKAFGNAILK